MKKLSLLIACLSLFSCASTGIGATRMMKSTTNGGRIMLIGSGSWMEQNSMKKAVQEMTAKCSQGYEITEEGLMERPADASLAGTTHVQEKYLDFKCR
jgi:chloramphenicol 3-O-phosphotransferase